MVTHQENFHPEKFRNYERTPVFHLFGSFGVAEFEICL